MPAQHIDLMDTPVSFSASMTAIADARKWAWEQAMSRYGDLLDLAEKQKEAEAYASRLSMFVQTGSFECI